LWESWAQKDIDIFWVLQYIFALNCINYGLNMFLDLCWERTLIPYKHRYKNLFHIIFSAWWRELSQDTCKLSNENGASICELVYTNYAQNQCGLSIFLNYMNLGLIGILFELILILKTWAVDIVDIVMEVESRCLSARWHFVSNFKHYLITIFQFLSCDDITLIIHVYVINSLNDSVHQSTLSASCGTHSHHNLLTLHHFNLFGVFLNVPKPPY